MQALEDDINRALEQSFRLVITKRNNRYGNIPEAIKDLIHQKNRTRRKAHRIQHRDDMRVANALHRKVYKVPSSHYNYRWQGHLEQLDSHRSDIWNHQKILRSNRKTYPPIHEQREMVLTGKEKSIAFKDTLEDECQVNICLLERFD